MNLVVLRSGRRAAELDLEDNTRAEANIIVERDRGRAVAGPQVAFKKDVTTAAAAAAGEGPQDDGGAVGESDLSDCERAVLRDVVVERGMAAPPVTTTLPVLEMSPKMLLLPKLTARDPLLVSPPYTRSMASPPEISPVLAEFVRPPVKTISPLAKEIEPLLVFVAPWNSRRLPMVACT